MTYKNPTLDADPSREAETCARAWHVLRLAHNRVAAHLAAELDRGCALTITSFDVLLYLHLRRDAQNRISDLGIAVALSQPALSRLVSRLVERGLIERRSCQDDARSVLISLTPVGAELTIKAMGLHAAAVHSELTSRLADHEQAFLLATLDRIGKASTAT